MRGKRNLFVLFLVTLLVFTSALTAFASTTVTVPTADKDAFNTQVWSKLSNADRSSLQLEFKTNKDTTGLSTELMTYNQATGTITFNSNSFESATDRSKKDAMGKFVKALQESNISPQSQQSIFDGINAINSDVSRLLIPMMLDNTSADLFSAFRILNPFMPAIRTALGVLAAGIVFLLTLSTIVDLAFIGLPVARENLNNKGDQNGGKIPFVSADAVSVVKETESSLDSGGKYKNVYGIYFRRRSVTYIIFSVCILYLVLGELGTLIGWILNLGSGIVG